MSIVSRHAYTSLYGPTAGDRFRLADTSLIAQVERSLVLPGEEAVYGGGKVIRDGMGQIPGRRNADGVLDLVITSVIVMDPILGIVKADIGIKGGLIVGIGQAGNPNVQDGVDPNLLIGAGTEVISGEGLVATAGAVETHAHFLTPDQVPHAVCNGVTTLIGGGTGPAEGSRGTTCTPGPWNLARMLEATAELPVNIGLLGKGNSSRPETLAEQLDNGACGLKVHEDWGATPAALDCALTVADDYDVQVALHADTLNESGYLADTIAAIDGRVIHSYHTEGAGGGHAPDHMAIASLPNVLPSSTNPTRPYTTDTTDNLFYMTVVTHHLNPANPEDIAFAQSRIRPETEAAEDVLHDLGVLSMYSADSQAMGRIGDTVTTCWRTADKMKKLTGSLAGDPPEHDNERILRYLAKLTINPAITHGIGHRLARARQGRRHRVVADEHLRRQAKARREGRPDRLGSDGRSERLDPDTGARIASADVRCMRPRGREDLDHVHVTGQHRGRRPGAAGLGAVGRAGARLPHDRQGSDGPQRRDAGDLRRPGDVPGHR
jgi:urease subunit alpha